MKAIFLTLIGITAIVTSSAEPIRIACVGDSITFGAGIRDRQNKSYPAQLSGGRAAVQTEAGWGYVDASGDLVVPATYTRAESFRNGLARVYSGRLLRYIDADGETVWAQP